MSLDFRDKVVLITGAGRGLGRALALAFAAHGAIVAANDLTPVNVDETIAALHAQGGRGSVYLGDVSKKMPVQGVITALLDDWGRLDIVVNNAAVRPSATLLDLDEWDWQRVLGVNLGGPFLMTQVAGRVFREQGTGGVILNIGDAAPHFAAGAGAAAYAVTKAALLALTREAGRELTPYGVRVHALCPGAMDVPSTRERWPEANVPLKPEIVARQALQLCALDDAAGNWIQGEDIFAEGT
ncbi:MAG: hypothetical protein Fur0018_05790 [Anaerolineales bacterium]